MNVSEHDVVVIGAGISGLTAAWNLKQAGIDVKLLEAGPDVGGVMRTERRDGFLLEKGPFNVLIRNSSFEHLLDHFQDRLEPISASGSSGRNRFVMHRSRLCKVPSGPIELLTTPLLSPLGKLRLLRGLLFSRRGRPENRSIDEAATRRFGKEVADRLVSAVCVGIYAAKSSSLSLAGCFPKAADVDDKMRSPLLFALRTMLKRKLGLKKLSNGSKPGDSKSKPKPKPKPKRRGLVSFREGLSGLTTLLAEELGNDLQTNCETKSIHTTDSGYEITCIADDGQENIVRCKRVALCVGKSAASTLLKDVSPTLQHEVEAIPSSPVTVLNLAFNRKQISHPLDGYGFLVPSSESDYPLIGVLWADSVFPHHAPAGSRLLRVFIKESHGADDNELVKIAVTALRDKIQLTGEPTLVDICRWPDSIPHYALDHVQRVDRIDKELQNHSGLHLLGNYTHGMSINDCVKNAARGASLIIEQLNSSTQQSTSTNKEAHQRRPASQKAMEPISHA